MSQIDSNSTLVTVDHQLISQVQTEGLTVALCGLFYVKLVEIKFRFIPTANKLHLDMATFNPGEEDKIIFKKKRIENIFLNFNAVLSDGVVIWRAWVLVNKRFYHKAVALYVKDGHDSGKASVEKVLFILVESGLVVLTSLVIITIFNVTQPSSSFTQITAEGGTQLSVFKKYYGKLDKDNKLWRQDERLMGREKGKGKGKEREQEEKSGNVIGGGLGDLRQSFGLILGSTTGVPPHFKIRVSGHLGSSIYKPSSDWRPYCCIVWPFLWNSDHDVYLSFAGAHNNFAIPVE
ncbi:hypothetical protein K435DRAFT_808437 [Dendrothele bispora CBS 962.96]|uniref:Uncharacterized protein n=1 Tax=Dendrothele bispora (strain CBS 962.96) TaxID=1314807 RepID=A0A4S8L1U7_DENBC|nr:hypothetical protein K435DRAFT_808437 [Dendrothele bispora CBS 962.96]